MTPPSVISPLRKPVLVVELAQVETVIGGRHPRRILVPEEEIERERLLAEQVVVDDVGPDQIARPHHVEHVRHARAVEESALGHQRFETVELVVVGEQQQIAGEREVDLRRQQRAAFERLFAALGKVGEPRRKRRAADAVAEHVDLLDAGFLFHGADRFENAFENVVFERLRARAARPD